MNVSNDNTPALYINPLTDYGFKKVFGDEEIMREFLNDLLQPASPITHVNFLNKDMIPENDELKGIIYDMRCETENGSEIIVEMQNRGQTFFRDRILYYLAQSIAPQGWRGKKPVEGNVEDMQKLVKEAWDFKLKPVYGVFFLNFPLNELTPRLIRTVRFKVEETGEVFNDKVRAYTIELPCIKDKKESDCKDVMEYWSYNLYNMETMNTQLPFMAQKPIFMKIAEIANYAQLTTEQQDAYMRSLNNYRTVMAAKEYDYTRGRQEGEALGMKKGEYHKALSIAQYLKSAGMPVSQISQATGLTEDEVRNL